MSFVVMATRNFGWLERRLGPDFHLSPRARAIAVRDERSDRILGMTAYDGWTANAAQVHIALDTPVALRALVRPAFQYPFEECDKRLLFAMISSANKRSLQLTERLGFRPTYRIEDAVEPGVSFVLVEMRRDECRWLR